MLRRAFDRCRDLVTAPHWTGRLLRGAAWNVLSTLLLRVATLATTIIVARLIGPDSLGKYTIVYSTINMCAALSGLGLGLTATKYVAEYRRSQQSRLLPTIVLTRRLATISATICAIVLLVLSDKISRELFHSSELGPYFAIASVAVAFSALDAFNQAVLIGFESMKRSAIGTMIGATLSLPIVAIATWTFGLDGAVASLSVTAAINYAISSRILNRATASLHSNESLSKVAWQEIGRFALPAFASGMVPSVAHWSCISLLAQQHGRELEVALFGIALQWFQALLLVPSVAARAILPVLSDYLDSDESRTFRKVLTSTAIANLLVMAPLAGAFAFVSPLILFAYGTEFSEFWPVLALSGLCATTAAVSLPAGHALAARDKMWIALGMNLGWGLVYILVALYLVKHGPVGIMLALLCAYIAHTCWVFTWAFLSTNTVPKNLQ